MFFFFFSNDEKRIGIKQLTKADLGLSPSSRQTHIGLYEGVFTFLDDSDVKRDALLIYGDSCTMQDCLFDRIENPDGSFRSPKIRKGNDGNSIVDKIRAIAQQHPTQDWYLAWSGLESEQLVFWLFSHASDDYLKAVQVFPSLSTVVTGDSPQYEQAKILFLDKVNGTSNKVQKDIEVASQTGKGVKLYKRGDLEKADRLFKEVGRKGEEMVAEYLERQKNAHIIESYEWRNASKESGDPFDFVINPNRSSEQFVDVKATRFDFEQFLYYSDDEIKFVYDLADDRKYAVYRVYNMETKDKELKICSQCLNYLSKIHSSILEFDHQVSAQQAILQSIKLGVKPDSCFMRILPPVLL